MNQGRLWTREELMLAINLYSKLQFGKMHSRNPRIIEMANMLNRTPGSVAFKLVNFASLDPALKKRGIKGASHSSGLDKVVWAEFERNWDMLFEKSEHMLAKKTKRRIDELYDMEGIDLNRPGMEKMRMVKSRLNQYKFRQMVLANYNSTCCITGMQQPQLLIASHITTWSKYKNNRLNPSNGVCLNALHDKAFESGLITINSEDYTIRVSSQLKRRNEKKVKEYFLKFEGKKIILPKKFLPAYDFLKIHNNHFKA